jgi:DNA-binding MarR family transcriptional regulator
VPTDSLETLFALASAYARTARALEVSGLSFAELRLLTALSATQTGRRPTEIADELHLSASGVTRALLPLEKRGIIERRADPGDGRASLARLTPAGKALVAEALERAGERASRLLRRLRVGQAKQLQHLLEEIDR